MGLAEVVAHIVFCGTAWIYTPALQQIAYLGAGDLRTGFFPLTQYLGMSMVLLFFPSARRGVFTSDFAQRKLMLSIALADLTGTCLCYAGLVYAGSGLYVVLYASVVLWTGLWRKIFLKRPITALQSLALAGIFAGLASTAADATGSGQNALLGIALTCLAAMVYGATYVACEHALNKYDAMEPATLCAFVGLTNAVLLAVYVGSSVLPRIRTLFLDPLKARGNDSLEVAILFAIAWLTLGAHYMALYLICNTNAVAAGVNRGAQTVGVFAISSLCFCSKQALQCYTVTKGVSTAIVVASILLYSIAGSPPLAKTSLVEDHGINPSPLLQK